MINKAINVNHEWGKLKEAVVGIASDMRIPNWSNEYEFLTVEIQQFIRNNQGKLLQEAAPDLYKKSISQIDGLAKLLESKGAIVHRPKPFTEDEKDFLKNFKIGGHQYFPRDPILVIGNNVIETSLREFERRKERFPIRRSIETRITKNNANWISMPQPIPVRNVIGYGPGPFLEGGDVLLVGNNIYVGYSGHATNLAGIKWLQHFLGNQYKVHPIKLNRGFLHLDVALSLPRPGLAVICHQAFADGLPNFLRNWDLIEVTPKKASELACNGLVIDEKNYICATEHEKVAEQLVKHGQTVYTLPYDVISLWGGSFRCSHHPLVRES